MKSEPFKIIIDLAQDIKQLKDKALFREAISLEWRERQIDRDRERERERERPKSELPINHI